MADKSAEGKIQLELFFAQLDEMGSMFTLYTSEVPKRLFINPDIMRKLAKVEGFYQRKELQGIVPAYAPIVRYFKLSFGVVMIVDDWEEKFFHFD